MFFISPGHADCQTSHYFISICFLAPNFDHKGREWKFKTNIFQGCHIADLLEKKRTALLKKRTKYKDKELFFHPQKGPKGDGSGGYPFKVNGKE